MMLFSKMKWFCNCCGKEMDTVSSAAIGSKFRTCSLECNREIEWRHTLSILGKEYTPDPNPVGKRKQDK